MRIVADFERGTETEFSWRRRPRFRYELHQKKKIAIFTRGIQHSKLIFN